MSESDVYLLWGYGFAICIIYFEFIGNEATSGFVVFVLEMTFLLSLDVLT